MVALTIHCRLESDVSRSAWIEGSATLDEHEPRIRATGLPGIMLRSVGMGLVFVPVTLIATSGVPADDAGLASGLFNTSQQIGGALGLALLTTLATSRTKDELASLGGAPTGADRADAFVSGYHLTWLASAVILFAGGLLLFALLRRRDVVAVAEGEVVPVAA